MSSDRVGEFDWGGPGFLIASLVLAICCPPVGFGLALVLWAKGQRREAVVTLVVTAISVLAWLNIFFWHHEVFRRWQDVNQLP